MADREEIGEVSFGDQFGVRFAAAIAPADASFAAARGDAGAAGHHW